MPGTVKFVSTPISISFTKISVKMCLKRSVKISSFVHSKGIVSIGARLSDARLDLNAKKELAFLSKKANAILMKTVKVMSFAITVNVWITVLGFYALRIRLALKVNVFQLLRLMNAKDNAKITNDASKDNVGINVSS